LHGLERRDAAGLVHRASIDASQIDRARRQFEQLAWRHAAVEVEDKGLTVALHYRRAPALGVELAGEVQDIVDSLGGNYRVQPGSCVLEITPRGASKADAVEAFLDERPFSGLQPLYAGDDLTDLAAFEAVERLGGLSIAVGDRVRAKLNFPTVMHFPALPGRAGGCVTPDVAPQDLELGVIGNCEVAALIDAWGRIVWACLPRLDGDPVFCGLLKRDAGSSESGVFAIDLHNFSHASRTTGATRRCSRPCCTTARVARSDHRFLPALPCA
jgi:hypothetical protein